MAMMREPELHWRVDGRWPWRAIVAIVLLLAGAVLAWGWQRSLSAAMAQREVRIARLAALEETLAAARPAPTALSEFAARQLRAQRALLDYDWARLSVLLAPRDDSIRLLEVEVNPASGAMRLTGRAPTALDANAYARSLESHATLRDVRLLGIERTGGGVHFEVSAQWAR